ncbi:MAG: hypothetical protein ACLGGV_07220 [Bacteroidia bacterium]
MEIATKSQLVEKEDIVSLHFPKDPLPRTKDEKKVLMMKLQKAQTLGNVHHNKIKIHFQDDQGPKVVNTTVWALGTDYVVLKKGIFVPINRIIDVEV